MGSGRRPRAKGPRNGWRFCGKVSDVFTGECKEFCDALGDCVAIAAGGCCFAYRARCGGRTDRSNSQSYVYYEMEMQSQWGWPAIAAIAPAAGALASALFDVSRMTMCGSTDGCCI